MKILFSSGAGIGNISLERQLDRKLKDTWTVNRTGDLQSSESGVGHQVASLIQRLTVAALIAHWRVLDRIYTVSVLDVVVRVIEEVKGLSLEV